MRWGILAFLIAGAAAQTPPATGTISGTVVDAATGAPMAESVVRLERTPTRMKADSEGRFTFKGVIPGRYGVVALDKDNFSRQVLKTVTLNPGQDLTLDLRLPPLARVSGRILDQNKEPVPGIEIWPVWTEYAHGTLRQAFGESGESDDQGAYTLEMVEPGVPFALRAQPVSDTINPIAEAPPDPQLRKPTAIPTYYPDGVTIEAGDRLTLRPGEQREAVDIRLRKAPTFCAEGTIEGPNPLNFSVFGKDPSCTNSQGGKTNPDGKFRVCNLHPGNCGMRTVKATANGLGVLSYGLTPFHVKDADIRDLKMATLSPIALSGEVVWAGDPPDPPPATKASITLRPIDRSMYYDEFAALTAQSSLPGTFSFPAVLISDYYVLVAGLTGNQYVNNITYSGVSVMHGTFRAGTAAGPQGLQISLAHDGAFLNTTVADKDGNPVESYVVVMPGAAASDADLADSMITGQTDQNGIWQSPALPPGKYYVLAVKAQPKPTPETIANLRQSRNRAQEIELAPNGAASLKLPPPN